MANLQSQIDILAKAVVREHISFEEYKVNNKGSVSLSRVSYEVDAYNNKGVDMGGGDKVNYEEESYELNLTIDDKTSTVTMFTYSGNSNFGGFLFYDDNISSYIVNDKGEIINNKSENFNLESDTFIRRIGLNVGEIGEIQNNKNSERIVYIENKDLVDGTLLYNTDTLLIEKSNDLNWIRNYYVEFDESEDKKIQLIVNLDSNDIIYPRESKYKVTKDRTENETGVNFDILYIDIDGNSSMVYAYRSRNINSSEFQTKNALLGVHLTSTVTKIGGSAFFNCTKLTKIIIPDNVETIDDFAFNVCTGLTEVTFPKSMSTIGISAFEGCTRLKKVTIPNSVTTIGYYAFTNCSSLEQVTIPNSVTTIGDYAFLNCNNIETIIITNYNNVVNDTDSNKINNQIESALNINENTYTPDDTIINNTLTYTKNPTQ